MPKLRFAIVPNILYIQGKLASSFSYPATVPVKAMNHIDKRTYLMSDY